MDMMPPPSSVITPKNASCNLIRLLRCMSGPLVQVVWRQQRVTRGIRAGQHTDGAAPLHLQLGQISFEAGAGKERRVESAQGEIDDQRDVGVVTSEPFGQRVLGKREGRYQSARTGQRSSRVTK